MVLETSIEKFVKVGDRVTKKGTDQPIGKVVRLNGYLVRVEWGYDRGYPISEEIPQNHLQLWEGTIVPEEVVLARQKEEALHFGDGVTPKPMKKNIFDNEEKKD